MNVSLKLPDDLGREARQRALSESKSLADWIADLVARELSPAVAPVAATLLEALGDESLAGPDLPIPERNAGRNRPPQFP
jgi:hypothetical protein